MSSSHQAASQYRVVGFSLFFVRKKEEGSSFFVSMRWIKEEGTQAQESTVWAGVGVETGMRNDLAVYFIMMNGGVTWHYPAICCKGYFFTNRNHSMNA